MVERADFVLAAIPLMAVSGVAARIVITASGVATGALAAPLATIGFLATFGLICWELVTWPRGYESTTERP